MTRYHDNLYQSAYELTQSPYRWSDTDSYRDLPLPRDSESGQNTRRHGEPCGNSARFIRMHFSRCGLWFTVNCGFSLTMLWYALVDGFAIRWLNVDLGGENSGNVKPPSFFVKHMQTLRARFYSCSSSRIATTNDTQSAKAFDCWFSLTSHQLSTPAFLMVTCPPRGVSITSHQLVNHQQPPPLGWWTIANQWGLASSNELRTVHGY